MEVFNFDFPSHSSDLPASLIMNTYLMVTSGVSAQILPSHIVPTVQSLQSL